MRVLFWFSAAVLASALISPLPASAGQADVPQRFADGSVVPAGTNFVPPTPPEVSVMLPPYPAELMMAGVKGHFEGDLTISETGAVSNIEVIHSAGARLNRVARMHVGKLQFLPAQLDGKPVASLYRITFDWHPGKAERW